MKHSSALLAPRKTGKQKMGQSLSPEERLVELDKYAEALFNSQQWHGIGIDR